MRRTLLSILCGLALAGAARAADPAPVIAAERAFAADGLALGIKASFLKHAAPEAIIFAPEPVLAQQVYAARPDRTDPPLIWRPVWAGLARSGDLGFTTGPVTFGGQPSGFYFTVWRRQADGGWKWIYDGGAPSDQAGVPGADAPPAVLAEAAGPSLYPEAALARLTAAEDRLAAAAARPAAVAPPAKPVTGKGKGKGRKTAAAPAAPPPRPLNAAYLAVLAPDARVTGSRAAPATTPAAVAAELDARPPLITFARLGAVVSAAGDLAWTYGNAAWAGAKGEARGRYVRIWRNDRPGWRIVYDQVIADRP